MYADSDTHTPTSDTRNVLRTIYVGTLPDTKMLTDDFIEAKQHTSVCHNIAKSVGLP